MTRTDYFWLAARLVFLLGAAALALWLTVNYS